MNLIFGTDGIRGIANQQISANLVFFIGKSLAIKALATNKKPKILIGKDNRVSSDMLECSVAAGIMSVGVDVVTLGLCTTPSLSFLTKQLDCDYGVMITASHNPAQFNGIKIFDKNGFKLLNQQEEELKKIFVDIEKYLPTQNIGKHYIENERIYDYIDYVIDKFKSIPVKNLSIAVDCANGAGSHIIPYVFKNLFNNCTFFNTKTNGNDINGNCGSVDTNKFISIVKNKFDVGFAFDGDADRLVVVLKDGQIIDGETILYVFARYLKDKNKLNSNQVATTTLTNFGIENSLNKLGINVLRTPVGDKNIQYEMNKKALNLGAEQSGHIILGDFNKTADGLVAALMFLQVFCELNYSLTGWLREIKKFQTQKIDVCVSDRQKNLFSAGELNGFVDQIEEELGERGRVVVRPSGTESVIRILVEGNDLELIQTIATRLKEKIEQL